MTWVRSSDGEAGWNAHLQQFDEYSIYQSWRWGLYKKQRGWTAHRFVANADGHARGMLQALVRTYPFRTVVVWCPCGPVGGIELCDRDMMRQLAHHLGARALYCRASVRRTLDPEIQGYLRSNGWSRPAHPVGSNNTAILDLTQTEEQLLAGLNRNWRYSLRQSQKRGLAIEHLVEPPIEELTELAATMHASKGTGADVRASDMSDLFTTIGDQAIVYGCRNEAGRLMAFHSCAILGDRAWEMVAATSEEGRESAASFGTLWSLILHCRRLNVTHYDLAGVNDLEAPGVASFKRWTGADSVEWVGEWEWSTSPMLPSLVDFAIRRRPAAALP